MAPRALATLAALARALAALAATTNCGVVASNIRVVVAASRSAVLAVAAVLTSSVGHFIIY